LVELSHPDFTQTYRLVRNAVNGVSVTHEGPAGPFDYIYMPMTVKTLGTSNDMDQSLEVTFGDLGTVLPRELEAIEDANGMETKPTLVYRTYSSDDLTQPLFGPATLEIDGLTFDKRTAVLKARARAFNFSRSGTAYRQERFPMIEGMVR
jgi:hypothetical protein